MPCFPSSMGVAWRQKRKNSLTRFGMCVRGQPESQLSGGSQQKMVLGK
jgi:ABC-type sugar transport system ATPase subunit